MKPTFQQFQQSWKQLTPASQAKAWDYMKELRAAEISAIEAKAKGRAFDDFGWSVRLCHAFEHEGIQTLSQLASYSELELMRIPNVGRLSLQEIKDKLAAIGIELKRQ